MDDQYALSWMSFSSNLLSGYQSLYEDRKFTDVTLTADDFVINCHRAVLAISSDYFKKMLENCPPNSHPIIYLNNISQQNLKNLLEFIYYGETRVDHADLSQFILNAESLQIKGLMGSKQDTVSKSPKKLGKRKSRTVLSNQAKSCKIEEKVSELEYVNEEDLVHIKAAEEQENLSSEYPIIEEIEQKETESTIDEHPDDPMYVPEYENTDDDYPIEECDDYDTGFTQDSEAVIQYVSSSRNSLQIYYDGHVFNRYNSKNKAIYWRCAQYHNKACRAKLITYSNPQRIIIKNSTHNHEIIDGRLKYGTSLRKRKKVKSKKEDGDK